MNCSNVMLMNTTTNTKTVVSVISRNALSPKGRRKYQGAWLVIHSDNSVAQFATDSEARAYASEVR